MGEDQLELRQSRSEAAGLLATKLWLRDVRGNNRYRVNFPIWARRPWDDLKKTEVLRSAGFAGWFNWYEARLIGWRTGGFERSLQDEAARQLDLRVATQPRAFWERDAAVVNAEISGWITEARRARHTESGLAEPEPLSDDEDPRRAATIAGFIVDYLRARQLPTTIDDIRSAFSEANYQVIDKSMRGELSRLAQIGQITRLEKGLYVHPDFVDSEKTLPPETAIPNPEPSGIRYQGGTDEPIDLAPLSSGERLAGGPEREADYAELRAKAEELRALGVNQLGRLVGPTNRFLSLDEQIEHVRAKLFWSRMNTLRVVHNDHERALGAEDQFGDPDPRKLDSIAASLLKDLVETANIFVVGDPTLMELDALRPGPQEAEIAREEIAPLVPVIGDLGSEPDVATAEARESIAEQKEGAAISDESLAGRQQAELARRSIRNFVGELLRRAYAPVRAFSKAARSETGFAWKEFRSGAYKAAGGALAVGAASELLGTTHYTAAIVRFVAQHAEPLITYVTKAFQNPQLVEIIQWVVRFFS